MCVSRYTLRIRNRNANRSRNGNVGNVRGVRPLDAYMQVRISTDVPLICHRHCKAICDLCLTISGQATDYHYRDFRTIEIYRGHLSVLYFSTSFYIFEFRIESIHQ